MVTIPVLPEEPPSWLDQMRADRYARLQAGYRQARRDAMLARGESLAGTQYETEPERWQREHPQDARAKVLTARQDPRVTLSPRRQPPEAPVRLVADHVAQDIPRPSVGHMAVAKPALSPVPVAASAPQAILEPAPDAAAELERARKDARNLRDRERRVRRWNERVRQGAHPRGFRPRL